MSNFDYLKFYYGTEDQYGTAAGNGLIENCFYFTESEIEEEGIKKTVYKLRLNNHLIYSSNAVSEMIGKILENEKMQKKFANYLDKTSEVGQTVTSSVVFEQDVTVDGNLTVENDFTANNIQYTKDDNNKTSMILNANTITTEGNFQASNIKATSEIETEALVAKSGNITGLKKLEFADDATLSNLPTHISSAGEYKFDFKNGNLKLNKIEAKEIWIDDKPVSPENENIAKFDSLQIGNIMLTDDNGNLKITVIAES